MINTTGNLELKKPGENEFYDVNVFNDNADVIDKEFTDVRKNSEYVAEKQRKLETRVNNIISNQTPTDGNAELTDLRTAVNGKYYKTAGEAVRAQISSLTEDSINLLNPGNLHEGFLYSEQVGGTVPYSIYNSYVEIPINEKTTYVLQRGVESQGVLTANIIWKNEKDKGFVGNEKITMNEYDTTLTAPEGAKYITISYIAKEEQADGGLKEIKQTELMLSEGKERKTYVPAQVIAKELLGDVYAKAAEHVEEAVEIETRKIKERTANLLNPDKLVTGKMLNSKSGKLVDTDAYNSYVNISITEGKTYMIQRKETMYFSLIIGWYKEDGTFISGSSFSKSNISEYSFLAPEGATTLTVSFALKSSNATYAWTELMLSEGTERKDYLPYEIFNKDLNADIYYQLNKNSKTVREKVENVKSDIESLAFNVKNKVVGSVNTISKLPSDVTVNDDGSIVHERTSTTGNSWFEIAISEYDTKKNMLIFSFKVDEISEKGNVFLFGKKTSGATGMYALKSIEAAGDYSIKIDLNYYVVYGDLDLSKGVTVGIANVSKPYHAKYSNIYVYDDETRLNTDKSLGENLNDMLEKITANETSIESVKAAASNELVSPNGTKFIIQVADDGSITSVPKIPENILYVGNSLLLGFETFGMAASNSKEDYYFYINQYLTDLGKNLTTDRLKGSGFENCTTSEEQDKWFAGILQPKLNENQQLVIIQLGDNVNTAEKINVFEEGAKKLIRFIRAHAPKARVAWVGEWFFTNERQKYISTACKECGATFVNISDLPAVAGNKNAVGNTYTKDDGTAIEITSSGVANHPSSQGMKAIADRVINTLFE